MLINRFKTRTWDESGVDGITMSTAWGDALGDGGYFVQFKKGSKFPLHGHESWEKIIIISGLIRFNDITLEQGDFLQVDSNDEHDSYALEDTLLFVMHRGSFYLK